jgi:translation initiation factor IF-2
VPIRIYAFAKELGLDNKQLLDICEKVNIKGKGSALASLDDDEVAKIKEHMLGASPAASAPSALEAPPMRPPTSRPAKRKIAEIAPPPSKSISADAPTSQPESPTENLDEASQSERPAKANVGSLLSRMRQNKPDPEPPAPPVPPIPRQVSPAPTEASKPPAVQAPLTPRRPGPLKRNVSVRDLDSRPQKNGDEAGKRDTPRRKSGLNVKFAAMPEVKQPTGTAAASTEKVQKPDIALPQDAIAKARSGASPLDAFTKSKTKTKKKGKGKESETADALLGEMPSSVRRSGGRRDKTGDGEGNEMGARPVRPSGRRGSTPGTGGRRPYRRPSRSRKSTVNSAAPRKDKMVLQLPCTIREFSEAAGVPAMRALFALQKLGDESNKNINSNLENEMVEMLVEELDVELEIRDEMTLEESVLGELESIEDDEDSLQPRAPIVTFLGHVDHGKTSLLDALIGIDVVSGEAGGITQHIRAYEIFKGDQKIAFVDTPGHEAFTEMRARGANVTDIAVLVVAADDGIMPQTEEAISHAKAAGVPIIVALNKIDLPGVTADKTMQDLATHDLLPSEWGGEIEVVQTSAISGIGLDELLETILVTAELHDYKANFDRPAFGTCIEAEQQSDRGVVAKLMVQGGTLRVGDNVVCGSSFGRVKAIHDTLKPAVKMEAAEPSTPVNITGFDEAPGAGDKFYVVDDIAKARDLAADRRFKGTIQRVGGRSTKTSLQDFQSLLESGDLAGSDGEIVTLNLIIRADVRGSLEAIQKELGKIDHPEVEIKILQALPGGISVADIRLADASDAVVVGFNVVADEAARSLADDLKVEIRRYDVIYKITDDLRATLEGRLKPEEQIVELGMAMVLKTFNVSRTGTIAGCRVMRGSIERDSRLRIIRDSRVIGDYAIDSLKREKDDAKEVARGMECGIKLAGFNDVKEGDTFEAYKIEEVARTL